MNMNGNDSKLVYVACHFAMWLYRLLLFAGILWLAYALKSAWALLGLLVCPWGGYKHDYNRGK